MRRPWNIVDMPVYSLATHHKEEVNMNICTYVSAISMKPKIFMVAIDYHTRTYENLQCSERAVLQLLHEDHSSLVRLLGKSSGKKINKEQKLKAQNMLGQWNSHKVLKGACAYLSLKVMGQSNIGGDHELFYFEVEKSTTKSEHGMLMFQDLIKKGIIL